MPSTPTASCTASWRNAIGCTASLARCLASATATNLATMLQQQEEEEGQEEEQEDCGNSQPDRTSMRRSTCLAAAWWPQLHPSQPSRPSPVRPRAHVARPPMLIAARPCTARPCTARPHPHAPLERAACNILTRHRRVAALAYRRSIRSIRSMHSSDGRIPSSNRSSAAVPAARARTRPGSRSRPGCFNNQPVDVVPQIWMYSCGYG